MKPGYISYLLVLAALILGMGLRLHDLNVHALGGLEISAGASQFPAYPLMLNAWRALAGSSEFSLRMLSVLAGIVTIAAVYAIGASLFDRPVGVISALFVAINPYTVWHSRLAEPSMLFAMLAAISLWMAIKVLNLPGRMIARRFNPREAAGIAAGFILANTLGLYTHRSFGLVMLAESLIFVVWLARRVINARNRPDARLSPARTMMHGLRVWLLLMIIPILLFVPWLLMAHPTTASTNQIVDPVQLAAMVAYGVTLPLNAAREGLIPLGLLALVGLFPPIDEDNEARRYLRFPERAGLLIALLVLVVGAFALRWNVSLLPATLALGLLAARGVVFGYDLGTPTPGTGGLNTFFIRLTMVAMAIFAAAPMVGALGALYGNAAMQPTTRAAFGDPPIISLDGCNLNTTSLQPGDTLDVTLYWHTDVAPDSRLKVFVHLYGADGNLLAQHDSEPADFARPTDSWLPGETIRDLHRLEIPASASQGSYRIAVGMYPVDGGARLPVMQDANPIGDLLLLEQIEIR